MGKLKYPNKDFVYSRLYHIYNGIKQRCYYPKAASYKWYGAKALTTPVKYYKKQFTENEIEQMKIDKENGMSYKELGLKYNADRCIISKFVRGLRN